MKLIDELRNLDPRDPGRWPLAMRAGAVAVCFVVVTVLCMYFLVWQTLSPQLQTLQDQETALRGEFRDKHSKAVNLDLYKQQLTDIEKSFGFMLRQLPSKTEVDNLLEDISQVALAQGLQQKLFEPMPEAKLDFYAERPIQIRLTGGYHQFGQFVSGIAALGRIVTLHDVQIHPITGSTSYDQLEMNVTAKTYRYLDDEEVAAMEADKRKADAAKKKAGGGG